MLDYALRRSFEEMKTTLFNAGNDLNSEELKKEVNFRVGTFLHWLIDNYKRLEKLTVINKDDSSFLVVYVMLIIN